MLRKTTALLLLIAPAFGLAAAPKPGPDLAAIRAAIEKAYPRVQIKSMVPSETMKGWLEVVTPDHLVYVDEAGARLFVGNVIELATQTDLTAQRWSALNKIDFSALPLNLAITVKHGSGSRQLAVFADPLCPFCQQLEQQIAELPDVTVHTFLFPLESLHPGATEAAGRLWCSADRSAAWVAWMQHKTAPENASQCDTQGLTTILNLGKQLKVGSTPTLFFADGTRADGLISNAEIERSLDAASRGTGRSRHGG
jgi:thiol:disulfide interchange protein DsbC